ncbi:hypothetical protein KY311_03410, partial [Candidatus Woesearchaeota archaeon]|nr:hypothetical protein [Candidatus Woesearchaeota archaeon]
MAESKEDKKKKKTDISTLKEDIKKIKDSNIIKDKDKEIVKRIDRFFKDFEDVVDEKDKKKAVKNFKEKTFRSLDKNDLKTYIGKPKKEFLLIDEKYNQNVEPAYFWVLGFMRDDLGIKDVQKLIDTYSASEASAFAKSMGQSLGAIQDRVTQNMRSIGQLLKELFQMVREIRILDEKVMLYEEGLKMGNVRENSAEITLKGQYIDLVEGGATSPSSIYGLATKVGFSLLPDLFFRTHVFEPEEVGKIVQQLKFNEKVKEVLARKLRAYAGWRKTTYQTLSHRRNFMVKYLRQHYNAIKLNMQWLKPYLKTMQRLEQKPGAERKPDLIAAVEQAFMEIELFATIKKFGKYNAITDVNFTFRTNPEMMYDAQMQYRKPSHT